MKEKVLTFDEHGAFTSENSIAIIWNIDDVRQTIDDQDMDIELTDDECMEVLDYCVQKHDANFGIGWDTLQHAIGHCFPKEE